MSAMWCCPQLFVQPEMLMRRPPDLGRPGLLERLADVDGEARLWVTARLQVSAPGHDTTSASQLGARLGHADGGQPLEQDRQLLLGQVTEGEVLAVRDADRRAELRAGARRAPGTARTVMSPSRA
jgi:hypothetical protein